jgi:hypothetical protein
MSGSAWGFIWLMLILKIPIAALLYLVYWAVKQTDEPVVDEGDGGGGQPIDTGPRVRPPQPPRRGPHGDPAPAAPQRTRPARPRPHVPAGHR